MVGSKIRIQTRSMEFDDALVWYVQLREDVFPRRYLHKDVLDFFSDSEKSDPEGTISFFETRKEARDAVRALYQKRPGEFVGGIH